MAVNKVTSGSPDFNFSAVLARFASGKMYIGSGKYTRTEAEQAFADASAAQQELATNYDEIGEMAEKPGKIESKAERLKTHNYLLDGKRTTTIELNIVGVTEGRINWMEQKLNDEDITIVLEDTEKDNYLIFNGLRWVFDWNEDIDGLFNGVLATEFAGKTQDKIMIYAGLS